MTTKFASFSTTFDKNGYTPAHINLNTWIDHNPDKEIVSWQACPVSFYNNYSKQLEQRISITIEYRDKTN